MTQNRPRPTIQAEARPPEVADQPPQTQPSPRVVPLGTLMVIGVLLLSIVWLWMLVLGIQQGRAGA